MRTDDDEKVAAAKMEFELLLKLKHDHIVKVHEIFVTPSIIYMVMEYVEGQELFDRIMEIEKYDENAAR